MRKTLAGLLAAIALLVGGLALPADATTLQPYQTVNINHGGCSANLIYGMYGSVAFANLAYLTDACNGYTEVTLAAQRNGFNVYTTCNGIDALFNPSGRCHLLGGGYSGIQTTVSASVAWGAGANLCTFNAGCLRFNFSVFG